MTILLEYSFGQRYENNQLVSNKNAADQVNAFYSDDNNEKATSMMYEQESSSSDDVMTATATAATAVDFLDDVNESSTNDIQSLLSKEELHNQIETANQKILEKLYFNIDHNKVSSSSIQF